MGPPSTAVILAGGAGVRLRPITDDMPKALVKVGEKPLLQWVVEWLRDGGVDDIVIGVAYLKEKITRYFGNGSKFGVHVRYSVHSVEGGTGEGFRLAIRRHVTSDDFLALNCDQIANVNLRAIFRSHTASKATATLAVVHPQLPFGLVHIDSRGLCVGFEEKPLMRSIFCSAGIYVFNKSILQALPRQGDIEKTTFPTLAKDRRLKVYIHNGSFLTVNSLRELEVADREMRKKALK